MLRQERRQCVDEGLHVIADAAREPARVSEEQARMGLSQSGACLVESSEVFDVLGDNRSPIGGCSAQQIGVGKSDEFWPFLDSDYFMPKPAQFNGNCGRVHLIQQQLHPDSKRRSFSQTASSRSAIS